MNKLQSLQRKEKENRKEKILNCLKEGNFTILELSEKTGIKRITLQQDLNTLSSFGHLEDKGLKGVFIIWGLSTGLTGGIPDTFEEYDIFYENLPERVKSNGKWSCLLREEKLRNINNRQIKNIKQNV